MGKRIDYDLALKSAAIKPNDNIYAEPNKYGYRINVNHPQIKNLYEHYKRHIGEKILSDAQRLHFESIIYKMMERTAKEILGEAEK
ncbi:MAG: hypothetical protein K5898_03480 [Ruminococcus sp.]|uniref:hypothetical protein n=1 Tax=Ruminococcus sp. TaxID=41978 RepID=UPI0025DD74CE|nr:hypothetical protein [Ruminococcus sp.]MCR4794229.1 hypothetical protein [Ruminococcus sp.]